jgi:hypothetical protein
VRGTVRAQFDRNRGGDGELTGRIENLLTSQVSVPLEFRAAIGTVSRTHPWGDAGQQVSPFQVTVAFGKRFEPWVIAASAAK